MSRMAFLLQSKFLAMKAIYRLFTTFFIILFWISCKKEHEIPKINPPASELLPLTGTILTGCDDTTAFKSSVDLQPLDFLKSCYLCTAIKQVPGLGEIPWVGNCYVRATEDTVLHFEFLTYEPYFEELLLREIIIFSEVPINIGFHQILNHATWAADPSKSYGGYARLLDDGDVLDAYWGTDTTCVSYIEITRLDLEDREVEGKFEIHLKMVSQGKHGILYSERINFLNGRFKAEIKKK